MEKESMQAVPLRLKRSALYGCLDRSFYMAVVVSFIYVNVAKKERHFYL